MVSLPEILTALSTHDNFLVTSHINPDGDAIGSIIATVSMLNSVGKKATGALHDAVPRKYRFLDGSDKILSVQNAQLQSPFDAVIVLDVGSLYRVGTVMDLITPEMPIINIDHHDTNDGFGMASWVDASFCSTSAMLIGIQQELEAPISSCIANALYTGIITDTGRFRFQNTTSDCLKMSAYLLDYGAEPSSITSNVYYNNELNVLRGLGQVLSSIQLECDGKVAHSYLERSRIGIDTEGFSDYLSAVKDVEIAFLMQELTENYFKVSLRSNNNIDVSKIAERYNGGGHQKAAGCLIRGSFEQVKKEIIGACEEEILKNGVIS